MILHECIALCDICNDNCNVLMLSIRRKVKKNYLNLGVYNVDYLLYKCHVKQLKSRCWIVSAGLQKVNMHYRGRAVKVLKVYQVKGESILQHGASLHLGKLMSR